MSGHVVIGLVLNYRDAIRTIACVRGLLSAGVENVLVVDNSGTDAGMLRADQFSGWAPGVVLLDVGKNLGFAAGVNLGVARCLREWPGCWVLLVNNDAIVSPTTPDLLVQALRADALAATAFGQTTEAGRTIGWLWYQPFLCAITLAPIPGSLRFASGCCQLVAPERAGVAPFDEAFFMYGEDVALSARLRREGMRQAFVEGAFILHEGNASSRKGSLFYETMLVRCHWRLAWALDRGSARRRGILLASRFAVLPLRAAWRAVRAGSLVPLRGLRAAWSGG